jgi:hypothetical protein
LHVYQELHLLQEMGLEQWKKQERYQWKEAAN